MFILVISFIAQVWQINRLTTQDGLSYFTGSNGKSIAAAHDTIWVVWADNRNGRFQIFNKYSTNGGNTWGNDGMVADSGRCPSVTIPYPNPSLRVKSIICWMDSLRYGNWEIFYQYYISMWYPPMRHTNNPGASMYPSITSDSSYVLLTWMDDRDGNWRIRYSVSQTYAQAWTIMDAALTTSSLGHAWLPQSALNRNKFYVVWQDSRDGNFEVYFKKSTDAGTTWSSDMRLTFSTTQTYWPTIAVMGQNIYVAYVEKGEGLGRSDDDAIYFIRSTDEGNSWSTPTLISEGEQCWSEYQYNSVFPMIAAKLFRVFVVCEKQQSIGYLTQQRWKIDFTHSGTEGQSWYPWTTIASCPLDDSLVWAPNITVDKAPNRPSIYVAWWHRLSPSNTEIYIAKDTTILIGAEENLESSGIKDRFTIHLNPVINGQVEFSYILTKRSSVQSELYDCLGRKASPVIKEEYQPSGEYHFSKSLNLQSGVYFLMLKIDNEVFYQKLIFIRR